jgi:hypothetical protein
MRNRPDNPALRRPPTSVRRNSSGLPTYLWYKQTPKASLITTATQAPGSGKGGGGLVPDRGAAPGG